MPQDPRHGQPYYVRHTRPHHARRPGQEVELWYWDGNDPDFPEWAEEVGLKPTTLLKPDQNSRYSYEGAEHTADEAIEYLLGWDAGREWAETALALLQPGDYLIANEPWADDQPVYRIA
jgi:hypothetical protein